jgi:hypothetical protein
VRGLTDANAALSGTPPVALSVTGSATNIHSTAAQVTEFVGADQANPIVLGTGKLMANPGAACNDTGSVVVSIPGSLLYAASASHYSGTATAVSLDDVTWDGTFDNRVTAHAGFAAPPIRVGTHTVGFNYVWCNPALVLPIAIVPATQ